MPVPEAPFGGSPKVQPDPHEWTYVCYAWPVDRGITGVRTFALHDRLVTQTYGLVVGYDGVFEPVWNGMEAFDPAHPSQNLMSPLAVNLIGWDGNIWNLAP